MSFGVPSAARQWSLTVVCASTRCRVLLELGGSLTGVVLLALDFVGG